MAVRELAADPLRVRPARVRRVRRETGDTVTLSIEPPEGSFPFAPGQYNMLYVFGAGEVPISISGDPTRPEVLFHTVRAVGAVTGEICGLRAGGVLGIRGPFGSGWPEAAGQDLLIVAGGIGLAPLRSVLCDAIAHRDRYGRVTLLYGARSPAELLYRHALERWRARAEEVRRRILVRSLHFQRRPVDRLAVKPRRGARLQPAEPESGPEQGA